MTKAPIPAMYDEPPDTITVRDYFAAKALAGIAGTCLAGSGMVSGGERAYTVAKIAYCIADAMLKAREAQR